MLARHPDLSGAATPPQRQDVQHVDVDSLEFIRPRSVGVEHVGLWAMDQLGLRSRLEELGIGASLRAAAIGSIIARMARPGSERATRRWLAERSALDELLGVDFQTLEPMQLYRASDALMAHREAIEQHLFDRAMDLFDLRPTVTLYDLTNTYFGTDQNAAIHLYTHERACPEARSARGRGVSNNARARQRPWISAVSARADSRAA